MVFCAISCALFSEKPKGYSQQITDFRKTQSWALSVYFFNFFNKKILLFSLLTKLITYFCTSPISKAQSN